VTGSQPRVDPAWAAARDRALPLEEEEPRASRVPALAAGAVVLATVGILGVVLAGAKPDAGSSKALAAAALAKPTTSEIPAPPPKPSPASACANLERWKDDTEARLRSVSRRYLKEHAGAKSNVPPMAGLEAILADSHQVKTAERCVEVHAALDAWEEANLSSGP
jgi:hypothetical protein